MIRPLIYLGILFLAVALKRAGLFKKEDAQVFGKVFLNITLPATAIHAFVGFTPTNSLFILAVIGFFAAIYIAYDRFGIQGIVGTPMDSVREILTAAVISAGYADKLLFSHDAVIYMMGRPLAFPPDIAKRGRRNACEQEVLCLWLMRNAEYT